MPKQSSLMLCDPSTGTKPPFPSHAEQWREFHGSIPWLYNPWTEQVRDLLDVGLDPLGYYVPAQGNHATPPGAGSPSKPITSAWLAFFAQRILEEVQKINAAIAENTRPLIVKLDGREIARSVKLDNATEHKDPPPKPPGCKECVAVYASFRKENLNLFAPLPPCFNGKLCEGQK